MQQTLLTLLTDAGSDVSAKVADALQPLILPFVQVLLFVVLCLLVRWVFRLLVGVLRWFNGVPLLGGVNRLLGLVLGLANGAVDCWLLALALWFLVGVTGGRLSWLNGYILSQSVGYGIFGGINPFM